MGLTAQAKITNVGKFKRGEETYQGQKPSTLLIELSIEMPTPKAIDDFDTWLKGGERWKIERVVEDCRKAKAPKAPKSAKKCADCNALVVKGVDHVHAYDCDACEAWFPSENDVNTHDCPGGPTCADCGKVRLEEDEESEDPEFCQCKPDWCCSKHEGEQRKRWERQRDATVEQNSRAWAAMQHVGVFMALIGTPLTVTLDPQQGAMAEMFPLLAEAGA